MATNPMKKRSQQAFLGGVAISLIITALVTLGFTSKIKSLQAEYDALKAVQSTALVLSRDIESGTEVKFEDFMEMEVRTTVQPNAMVSYENFYEYLEDGTTKEKKIFAKISMSAGTIVTPNMLYEEGKQTEASERIQEYNMLILPSDLKTDDFIDIRLEIPTGQNYIVVAKKQVMDCNLDTVWLNMTETEMVTLGNAIVEAYKITGAKLYATKYIEAGMQEAATPTYAVSKEVLTLINNNPNITEEARNALWSRYNDQQQVIQREQVLDGLINKYTGSGDDSVETGVQTEAARLKELREEYLNSLDAVVE